MSELFYLSLDFFWWGKCPQASSAFPSAVATATEGGKRPISIYLFYIFNRTFNTPGFLEYSNASTPFSIEKSFEIINEKSGL